MAEPDNNPPAQRPRHLPSPAEIARACSRFRRAWTDRQRAKRASSVTKPWTPPLYNLGDLELPPDDPAMLD